MADVRRERPDDFQGSVRDAVQDAGRRSRRSTGHKDARGARRDPTERPVLRREDFGSGPGEFRRVIASKEVPGVVPAAFVDAVQPVGTRDECRTAAFRSGLRPVRDDRAVEVLRNGEGHGPAPVRDAIARDELLARR